MVTERKKRNLIESKPLFIRRITKSGSTRYLSVGTILPVDWEVVKVIVERLDSETCVLKLKLVK